MGDGVRALALAMAVALLVAVDVVITEVDVFTPLLPDTRPTSLFTGTIYQMTDVVRTLYGGPADPRPAVFLGNSQLEVAIRPLGPLADRLIAAGAPSGTRTLSLCVFGTAPTDHEVIARDLGPVHPGVVVFGLSTPDVGTTLERAREMPVTRMLDVGWRDGPVPPADLEARLGRWARTGWRLYRYRELFHDLVLLPDEPRTPGTFLDTLHTPTELLELAYGPERTQVLVGLRLGFERGERFEDVVRYLDLARGPEYLAGLRARWRNLVPQPIQLEALRRGAAHVRRAGGRPVWILLPENPLLELDPEVGAEVRNRSEEVARQVEAAADGAGVPLIDFRRALPPRAFVDLNHLFSNSGDLMAPLAAQLAARGLLSE